MARPLGVRMSGEEADRIARVAALCREATNELGRAGSFRLRVLLQMVHIELARELARPAERGGHLEADAGAKKGA